MQALTLQAKAIIAAIILVLIGYSYYWTFSKGVVVGGSQAQKAAYIDLTKKLQEQADKDALVKQRELEEARQTAEQNKKYLDRKVINLENSNKILEEQKNVLLAKLDIPDELIGVLNDARKFQSP